MQMRASILKVEQLLEYSFKDQTLLVEALTQSSYTQAKSNQRLQFLGDAVLDLDITDYIFYAYPQLNSSHLTNLRSANVCNKKFARVAIRHELFAYLLRGNTLEMDQKVDEFAEAMKNDTNELLYDGEVPERKVLADMVEAIAAAVYLDCGSDLKKLWPVFKPLLEPILTEQTLQPHPVSKLNELCQKQGKKPKFKVRKEGTMFSVDAYVDGKQMGSSRSESQGDAKEEAAKAAVRRVEIALQRQQVEAPVTDKEAMQRLKELCDKWHWSKPIYK